MVVLLTNLNPNPSVETGLDGYSTNSVGSISRDDAWSRAGDWSIKNTNANGGGFTRVSVGDAVLGALEAGKTYTVTVSCHLAAPLSGELVSSGPYLTAGWSDGTTEDSASSTPAPNKAGDYTISLTFEPTGPVAVLWLVNPATSVAGAGQPENAVWWDLVTVVEGGVAEQFDGDTPDASGVTYEWTGTPHASTSVQMSVAPSLYAQLLSAGEPRPVQVVASDIAKGSGYSVVGVAADGRTWLVPGGVGVSDGEQIRLIDNRAPINAPISYRLTVGQQSATSETIPAIPWRPNNAESRYLIQSLSGSIVVPIYAWQDNDLPREVPVRSTEFAIHARRRPVVVLQPAAYGTTAVQIVLNRSASEKLDQILALGGALCVRTTGRERDLPPTDLALITEASSSLWGDVDPVSGEMSARRLWDLTLTWVDDPEPSTVPTVYTVDTVDALLAGMTVDEVDAMFYDLSVDDVDAFDWAGLAIPDDGPAGDDA